MDRSRIHADERSVASPESRVQALAKMYAAVPDGRHATIVGVQRDAARVSPSRWCRYQQQ
jgi:hypothetical protein